MITAPFNQKIYDESDSPAKDAVRRYLRKRKAIIEEHPHGKYGVDLFVIYKNGRKVFLEVERRWVWKEGRFPYETIHIPLRKKKFCGLEHPTYFLSFRKDLRAMIVIPSEALKKKFILEVPNRRVSHGEEFYDIPLKYTKFVNLENI